MREQRFEQSLSDESRMQRGIAWTERVLARKNTPMHENTTEEQLFLEQNDDPTDTALDFEPSVLHPLFNAHESRIRATAKSVEQKISKLVRK